ncbi:MAG: 30S ribosomal protein S6 [Candidatus Fermentibacteraceae bacterium]|nr:30S ribosomal protein S6 [Candidatus Fermentibacteraceae bacterium]
MRDYETVVIWSASIPETDIEKEHDRVVKIIEGNKGEYKGTDKWGRRMFAYPIKKQTEGIYHFIKWTGETDIIGSIDKHLRIHEGCIRYGTLRSGDEGVTAVKSIDDFDNVSEEVEVTNGSEDA